MQPTSNVQKLRMTQAMLYSLYVVMAGYDNKSSELHERGAQQSKLESQMNCDLTRVYFSRPSKRLCPKVDTSSTLSHTVHHDLAC